PSDREGGSYARLTFRVGVFSGRATSLGLDLPRRKRNRLVSSERGGLEAIAHPADRDENARPLGVVAEGATDFPDDAADGAAAHDGAAPRAREELLLRDQASLILGEVEDRGEHARLQRDLLAAATQLEASFVELVFTESVHRRRARGRALHEDPRRRG